MDPTPDTPPGCLVILTPLSAGMAADAVVRLAHRAAADGGPEVREIPKAAAARFLADELVEALVNTLAGGYPLDLDVAVLGYRTGGNGRAEFVPLLPPATARAPLVPLAGVADRPAEPRRREGEPRKWTAAAECAGEASPAAGLAEAYRLVSVWLTGRYHARPPVVIHCTDGGGGDRHYARVARSLGLLATAYGPPRLLHVGFAAGVEPALCGEWPGEIPGPWAGLAESSAELPAEPGGRPARRAVSVNDWAIDDAWSALFDLNPVADALVPSGPGGRFSPTVRRLWAQKMGNRPEEWEDAHAADPAGGAAVVADGASTGIYCRLWADQLCKRFVADRPDFRDPAGLGHWVHGLRVEWRTAINYPTLHWAKQRKVDETGAAATLLGLELGAGDENGGHPWRATAVGDACLFWVRDGELLATFPVVGSGQFGSAPLLVRSNSGFRTVALTAAGTCRPGDRFFLATDAVAARLLRSTETGPGPDWGQLEAVGEAEWRAEMDALRKANDMVNDDCTLVALRVAAADEPDEPPEAEAIPEAAEAEAVEQPGAVAPARPSAGPTSDLPPEREGPELTSPLGGEVACGARGEPVGGEGERGYVRGEPEWQPDETPARPPTAKPEPEPRPPFPPADGPRPTNENEWR
jgi:hypothetical protein